MLTVFANMLINSEERFEHLKDSFESFCDVSDDWLINIRGKKRDVVIEYLKERLGDKATFFELLNDARGWTTNAFDIVKHAKHPYILLWNEDHMNIAPQEHLRRVAEEMREQKAEFLLHSWWQKGKFKKQFEVLPLERGETIDAVTIDKEEWKKLRVAGYEPYLISLVGIFEKSFLERLLQHDRYMLPLSFTRGLYSLMTLFQRLGVRFDQKVWFHKVNGILRFKLRRNSKETPHDFEKGPDRFDVLPIRMAFTNQELFVCMDDDDDPNDPYSLATRGLYPIRNILMSWDPRETLANYKEEPFKLAEGERVGKPYCYYTSKQTRQHIVREYIHVVRGKVHVTVKGESLTLDAGHGASFYTNIPHTIVAQEDSEIVRYTPDLSLAPQYILT
ncbi:hypothetical protein A3A38_00275 [Candidatus Kaiserbacteria bacterium RIFCSPLOWO2_01_FULL_53_17]|uniref:Uncharacterized protein n=1 Tax=Candidatus Kaiserbacteria bacterium RIFCSPLOWO2_01_FULL_53_17 TaxID=1798511 RepID=A0A1F6EG88_9BACT|nr:MAG: hypothetical protein A3A38_00275 [Candidatus Kaiserbacteria bacterium RIFCSPLOWO2_01_FULL_53_17]